MPAQANSTLALISRKKIPRIFPWHENLSRVPRHIIFPREDSPRPLVICACVHVGKYGWPAKLALDIALSVTKSAWIGSRFTLAGIIICALRNP